MLITTGLNLQEYTLASVEQNLPTLWERFDLLAKKRSDRISLSGVPVASALGRKKMREILDEASQRTGVVCDTDLEAHIAAMKHLGVGKVALATRFWGYFGSDRNLSTDAELAKDKTYFAEHEMSDVPVAIGPQVNAKVVNGKVVYEPQKDPNDVAYEVGGIPQIQLIDKQDRKSTRLNSSHIPLSRMPSSA